MGFPSSFLETIVKALPGSTPLQLKESKTYEMALVNLETNNSIPNIHMHTSNNSFRYSPDDGANWFSIALSTGSYDIEDINNEIQRRLRLNKHKTKIIIMIAKDYSTSHGC